jgi:uncharacterized membrane protein (UPF0127 family)
VPDVPGARNLTRETDVAARELGARNLTRDTVLAARVEIGASLWAKFMGLMGRRSLPAGDGLWLPDDNGIHMFFMRFPIDALFLDSPDGDGVRRVVRAVPDLPPWRGLVPFVRDAKGVLELPAGTIAASGTEAGDLVTLG